MTNGEFIDIEKQLHQIHRESEGLFLKFISLILRLIEKSLQLALELFYGVMTDLTIRYYVQFAIKIIF